MNQTQRMAAKFFIIKDIEVCEMSWVLSLCRESVISDSLHKDNIQENFA